MGKFFTCSPIWMKFCTRVCLKPSNDGGEFELDRAKSNKNIAENSFALGHETDNRLIDDQPLITFAYSLDPDIAPKNVGPHLWHLYYNINQK